MRVAGSPPKRLIHVLLIMMSATAYGGEGLSVSINNDTTDDLLVTVYDMDTNPAVRVMSDQTINGFASLSVIIVADDSGEGHLSWTATTVGRDMRMCGHHDRANLNDGDTVNVSADAECGT
jgi:hypothetical protein